MKEILSFISTAGFILVSVLCLIAYKFGEAWAAKMMETIVPMVVQAWILNYGVIIQHKYGSSQGSASKDETIKAILERLTQIEGK